MLTEWWLSPRVRESSQYVCAAVLTMLRNECYWWLPHARWLLLCPPYHQSLQSHDRHNLWRPQPDFFWCHVFVRWIVIAISSCSNGSLDMVHQLVLGLYNNLLAIWQAIVSDNLCISSKIYDIIQYLINKFFHSLPDWVFCFYNLVLCIFFESGATQRWLVDWVFCQWLPRRNYPEVWDGIPPFFVLFFSRGSWQFHRAYSSSGWIL